MKFRVSPYGSIINFGEGGYSKLIKFNVESGEEEDLYTFPEGVRSFFFNDGWLFGEVYQVFLDRIKITLKRYNYHLNTLLM